MWTHKIGNILQGMMTYLELLPGNSEDNIMVQNELAKDLGREGNLVNRQVIALTKIKQTKGKPLGSVNLRDAFIVASEDILSYYSVKGTPSLDIQVNPDIYVEADALLDHLFLSLFIHVAKMQDVENLQINVNSESLKGSIITEIVCSEPVLSAQAQKYMSEAGITSQTQLGLELFIMKILLDRYHCRMEYSVDTKTKESRLIFHFKK